MDKDMVAQAAGVATVGGGRWRATPPAAPRREGGIRQAKRVWLIQRVDLGELPMAGRGGDIVAGRMPVDPATQLRSMKTKKNEERGWDSG